MDLQVANVLTDIIGKMPVVKATRDVLPYPVWRAACHNPPCEKAYVWAKGLPYRRARKAAQVWKMSFSALL